MLTKLLIAKGLKPPATYSPTISMLTFMIILALSVIFCFFRATMDVISAYLQIVYPQDARKILTRLGPRICKILGLDPKKIYLVKKYVYGLPDAGRRFYLGFTKLLAEKGYTMSTFDPCLFYRMEGEEKTFICIHVDDSYVLSNKREYIDKLKNFVTETMPIKVEHNANSFLGINFEQLPDGSVKLTQPKLVKKVLSKYKMNSKKKTKNNYPFAPERREDYPRKINPLDPEENRS
jgi:hypothetical protein